MTACIPSDLHPLKEFKKKHQTNKSTNTQVIYLSKNTSLGIIREYRNIGYSNPPVTVGFTVDAGYMMWKWRIVKAVREKKSI